MCIVYGNGYVNAATPPPRSGRAPIESDFNISTSLIHLI
jgi:hypothetical protein